MKQFLFLLALIPVVCSASQYTLDDLIDYGLKHSVAMEENSVAYKNAQSDMHSAWLDFLPSGSVSASKTNSERASLDLQNATYTYKREWDTNASFSASRSLAINEPDIFNWLSSRNSLDASSLSYEQQKKQIAYTVLIKYLAALEAQKRVAIQQENLALQERIYQRVVLQHQLGEKSLLEKQQAEITRIDYKIALTEATNAVKKARIDLFQFLNKDDEGYELVDLTPEIPELDNTLTNNALQAQELTVKNTELSLIQQYIGLYPSLRVGVDYALNNGDGVLDFNDYDDSYTVSINASYPLFDFFNLRESFHKAKRNTRLVKLQYEESKRAFSNEMTNLRDDIANLKQTHALYEQKLALADENLRLAQTQYQQGTLSILDYDKARIDKQNAEISTLSSYYSLIRSIEEYRLLTSDSILGRW